VETLEAAAQTLPARQRQAIRVRGRVQGVGFRPAVSRLARSLGLGGFVRNEGDGVRIEIEGRADAVAGFVRELRAAAPRLARIEALETAPLPTLGELAFHIAPSAAAHGEARADIPPDLAPCADCLAELHDPADRRHRYPFINCTACGPRFTIVRDVPYDRARTTMDAFALCAACAAEYADPLDRRYHAEPNACPACGPQLAFVLGGRTCARGEAALAAAVARLDDGAIVAVKGAGGFVLAADARSAATLALLRRRKQRPHKPFAVMARDLASVAAVARLDDAAAAALVSPARPIVLLRLRAATPLGAAVAPGLGEVGFFLPPTPLQHLLLHDGPPLQVMTSGNRSDEPIAKDDADALARLDGLADAFLLHDRAIHTRADDSVLRVTAGVARLVRRARGFVPDALALPVSAPPVLAVGAQQKGTVCLAAAGRAVLSQHLGELDELASFRFFEETIAKLTRLLGARPTAVAHDLHPDYRSTLWARASGLPCLPIQHHHAHVAACLAEHGRTGPALGVAFDGTGLGPGGELWGGELLRADLAGFTRLGHLRPLALPGGEAAVREPWRLALAALHDAGEPYVDRGLEIMMEVPDGQRRRVAALLPGAPRSTAAGRWFDAAAALCGLGHSVSYDGQAPCELEAAAGDEEEPPYPFALGEAAEGRPFAIDLRPTIRALAADRRDDRAVAAMAAAFHETLAQAIHAACVRARAAGAPALVALAGGCFCNRRLAERSRALLEGAGFEVLLPERVPAGDGGLSYGQAAIAAYRLSHGTEASPACV
jgi:hydrogenase maturation protein HypF